MAMIETKKDIDIDFIFNLLNNKHKNLKVWKKEDIPKRFFYQNSKRISNILCLADLGWTLTLKKFNYTFSVNKGSHGYDNEGSIVINNRI
jgi:hypothetical protein